MFGCIFKALFSPECRQQMIWSLLKEEIICIRETIMNKTDRNEKNRISFLLLFENREDLN